MNVAAKRLRPSGKVDLNQCGGHKEERRSEHLPTHNYCPNCGRLKPRKGNA